MAAHNNNEIFKWYALYLMSVRGSLRVPFITMSIKALTI